MLNERHEADSEQWTSSARRIHSLLDMWMGFQCLMKHREYNDQEFIQ